jgi:hypothetical protein
MPPGRASIEELALDLEALWARGPDAELRFIPETAWVDRRVKTVGGDRRLEALRLVREAMHVLYGRSETITSLDLTSSLIAEIAEIILDIRTLIAGRSPVARGEGPSRRKRATTTQREQDATELIALSGTRKPMQFRNERHRHPVLRSVAGVIFELETVALDTSRTRDPSDPLGYLDQTFWVDLRSHCAEVHGWAIDPLDPNASLAVSISLDGISIGEATADQPRADVERRFNLGPNHGFIARVVIPRPGRLSARARTARGWFPLMGQTDLFWMTDT